jgi:hypothetical protein
MPDVWTRPPMSSLNYDGPRRFSRPTSARTFPDTYYNGRHVSYDYPRADPYAYPMGGPVSGLRNRTQAERDEFQPEQGGARRRIAVAVSQITRTLPVDTSPPMKPARFQHLRSAARRASCND